MPPCLYRMVFCYPCFSPLAMVYYFITLYCNAKRRNAHTVTGFIKKYFNYLFLGLVFGFTLWSVFRGEDLVRVLDYLEDANDLYLIPSIFCVLLFILGESAVIFYLFSILGTRVKLSHCCLYSFIGFFYSCITPSASGGQPMQVIAMRKDNIPVAVSSVVLAIVTITYKMVLVLIGIAVLVLRPDSLMVYLDPVMGIMYLGIFLNIICISLLLLLVFHPMLMRVMAQWLLDLISRIRPSKKRASRQAKLEHLLNQYNGSAEFYRTHKHTIVYVFLITLLQRLVLFFITWLTYRSFALEGHSISLIVLLQAMISVAADMLPLPGGMGVSENLFLEIFHPIFGEALTLPAMMISRGISYYTQLIISGIMTLAAAFIITDKKKKGGKL